jgi:hypothetical protein
MSPQTSFSLKSLHRFFADAVLASGLDAEAFGLWPRFMINESEWPDSASDQSTGNSNGAQELCADGDSNPVTAGTAGEDALMNPEKSH